MRKVRFTNWLWLIAIAMLLMGCSISIGSTPTAAPIVIPPTDVPQPTAIPPTAVPPTAVPPTDTPVPTITPTPGPVIVDDDFSTDIGRFKCDNCVVEGGALIVGPFPLIDSYKPFLAICSDCGTASNYKMSVDTWYVEGNSNSGFGLVLRDGEDDDILFLAVSSWQVYTVFNFDTTASGGRGWESVLNGWTKGGLRAGRGVNSIEVLMQNSTLSITINGTLIRLVDNLPRGKGQVGVYVGKWEIGAAFDNFHFEELP